jgi:hypothetical protein
MTISEMFLITTDDVISRLKEMYLEQDVETVAFEFVRNNPIILLDFFEFVVIVRTMESGISLDTISS